MVNFVLEKTGGQVIAEVRSEAGMSYIYTNLSLKTPTAHRLQITATVYNRLKVNGLAVVCDHTA